MLDGFARRRLDPALDALAARIARAGVSANAVTFAACAVGLLAATAIAAHLYVLALILILVSRLGDGLDGAVAAINGRTALGGYLDIVLDFLFYGAILLGFVLADPPANGIASAVLLLAFYVNGASFLAFAAVARERGLESTARGRKSLFFTTGLAEATETIAVFALMCLAPAWFPALAYAFAAITAWTTLSRIVEAWRTFS